MPILPLWLRILISISEIPIVHQEIMKLVAELWNLIPWFHVPGAAIELKRAYKESCETKNNGPLGAWIARWKPHAKCPLPKGS